MKRPELLYYDLAEGVTAFSTTRHGGMSQDNYAELNINPFCGDDGVFIEMNLSLLAQELDVPEEHIFLPQQCHEADCFWLEKSFLQLPVSRQRRLLAGVDAMVTQQTGICIGVSTADCIPVLLFDIRRRVAGAVHAGWRGTRQRIVQKVIAGMRSAFGSEPADLVAQIGPGISLKNFEVGDEVYAYFARAGFPMEQISRRMPPPSPDGAQPAVDAPLKWHIDLPLCNELQLQEAGVRPACIRRSDICTYDRAADFFSARRLGADCGRIYTGIIIRREPQ